MQGRTPVPHIPTVSWELLKTQQSQSSRVLWWHRQPNQCPAKQERGRRSPFAHSHTPITAHLEPKMPALQSPPQHSLMGRRWDNKATYCSWDCTTPVKTRAGPCSAGPTHRAPPPAPVTSSAALPQGTRAPAPFSLAKLWLLSLLLWGL